VKVKYGLGLLQAAFNERLSLLLSLSAPVTSSTACRGAGAACCAGKHHEVVYDLRLLQAAFLLLRALLLFLPATPISFTACRGAGTACCAGQHHAEVVYGLGLLQAAFLSLLLSLPAHVTSCTTCMQRCRCRCSLLYCQHHTKSGLGLLQSACLLLLPPCLQLRRLVPHAEVQAQLAILDSIMDEKVMASNRSPHTACCARHHQQKFS
jgi:hypothetical protein